VYRTCRCIGHKLTTQDVDSSDSHSHTHTRNNEPTVPCKRHRTQPATDVSSIQPTDTSSHGYRADKPSSDLTLDKATDTTQSINVSMPSDLDFGTTREQASQSTDTAAETGVATTGQAVEPCPCHAGCPNHKHSKPIRFLDTIEVISLLIGQTGARYRIVSHVDCRLVFTRIAGYVVGQ